MKPYKSEMDRTDLPESLSDSEVLVWLKSRKIDWTYMSMLKDYTAMNDDVLSDWLNISEKTLRNYRKPEASIKDNIGERVLFLLVLFRHGEKLFGSVDLFTQWLNQKNFFFDNEPPGTYLNTVSGIHLIEERLVAMEFGDNV